MHFSGTGEFRPVELHGPASYEVWEQSYLCLRTALLMLGAVSLGRLDAYMSFIKQYAARYNLWAKVYEADMKCR
eukprot:4424480-Amphidinium_carterae.1